MEHKLESRLPGEILITSDMQMIPPYGRNQRTKESLDESERGEWQSWLKTQDSENSDHVIWSHHFMANIWKTVETVTDFILRGFKVTADGDCSHETKTLAPWKKSYDQPRQHIKNQRHYFANKGSSSQGYGFSSSHVWMWESDCTESWAPKNWCFWTAVLEKTLESPLDCKDIKPANPKGNHPGILIGRTDAPICQDPTHWTSFPDAGKEGRRRRGRQRMR